MGNKLHKIDLGNDEQFSFYIGGGFGVITDSMDKRKEFSNALSPVRSNFVDEYCKKHIEASHIAEVAKLYIMDNWQKVQDWSDLEFSYEICDGNKITFYNFDLEEKELKDTIDDTDCILAEFSKQRYEEAKAKHNPVQSVVCILDECDGDFSVVINGINCLFLQDREIITIAGFIEYKLLTQNNEIT